MLRDRLNKLCENLDTNTQKELRRLIFDVRDNHHTVMTDLQNLEQQNAKQKEELLRLEKRNLEMTQQLHAQQQILANTERELEKEMGKVQGGDELELEVHVAFGGVVAISFAGDHPQHGRIQSSLLIDVDNTVYLCYLLNPDWKGFTREYKRFVDSGVGTFGVRLYDDDDSHLEIVTRDAGACGGFLRFPRRLKGELVHQLHRTLVDHSDLAATYMKQFQPQFSLSLNRSLADDLALMLTN